MTRSNPTSSFLRAACMTALLLPLTACGGGDPVSGDSVALRYSETTLRLQVELSRELAGGESLHVQLRRGEFGQLDCRADASGIDTYGSLVARAIEPTYDGPAVPPQAFENPYDDPAWLRGEPTPEMVADAMLGSWIVDVCWMSGSSVVRQAEIDIAQSRDVTGEDGKFDGDEDERITSVPAYAEACVAELGEIPFFERIQEGDYLTASCLNGTPIPTRVTLEDGTVTFPNERTNGREISGYYYYEECDEKQYIYNSCEPNAVDGVSNGPRVQSARNEQGTHWVLLCRKSQETEGEYYDIAMIGNNPYTGQTCFFQNGLGTLMDGNNVPHPGDIVDSERSEFQSGHIWSGLQGGSGGAGGINCTECHDSDAFIHTPWIDGALNENGETVIPRMGDHEDFTLGFNDAPYDLVARDRVCRGSSCGWEMERHLVSEEAEACTSCHRIGEGRWADQWLTRLEPNADGTGTNDSNWNSNGSASSLTAEGLRFEHTAWMPPDFESIDAASWHESEFGQALDFIQMCEQNPSAEGCIWEELPHEAISDFGELPQVEEEGMDLAIAAASALGIEVPGHEANRRCAECHSTSANGVRHWLELTDTAETECNLQRLDALNISEDPIIGTFDGVEFTQGDATRLLNFINTAPEEQIDAAGLRTDALVELKKAIPVESMDALADIVNIGPATMQALYDFVNEGVERNMPVTQAEAMEIIRCMREAPEDPESVFEAAKMGIFTAGAQYGLFQQLFRRAYGPDDYLVRFLQFKARVMMPKGNHPRLSQREFATVLKWFRNDLNNIDDIIMEPPAPTTCTDTILPAMGEHIDEMRFDGWRAVNEENGIRNFGCEGDQAGTACLQTFAERAEWAAEGVGTLRELRNLEFRTSFWTRSSADGRFIGNGGRAVEGFSSTITDMLRDVNIGIKASYDPGFFPDNSGFIYQGGGTGLCAQSILETANSVNFEEDECIRASGINLYQHVARGLGGGDYFVINSQFTSDSGGNGQNPRAPWGASATMKFTPMVFNGSRYEQLDSVVVDSPFEGDSVLSPSGRVVVSRLTGNLGFQFRRVQASQFGSDYVINIDEPLATVCLPGSKANISYDERFAITHTYGENDTADIWIIDLTTGERRQVTNMPEGHLALFPHFRSDNWMYFLVRNDEGNERWVVASDAALVMAGE